MEIVLLDLFSGVGGFALGLWRAGFKITHHYFSEIDKNAIANYKYNFKKAEYVGSVVDVSGHEIRRKHPGARIIITFGFPCQDLSVAGKRRGLAEGTRSGLLNEAVRLVKEIQPDYYIAENVKGFYSSNSGMDFIIANEVLTYLFSDRPQYTVEQQLLNTKWILPQNRERTYFVGYPRESGCRQILPVGHDNIQNLQEKAGRDLRERVQARENGVSRRSVQTSTDIDGNVRESEYACHQTGVIHNNGEVKSIEVSTSIDASYHKGMDNHGQRTHIQTPVEFNRIQGDIRAIETAICLNSSDWRGINRNQSTNAVKTHRAVLTPDRFEKRQNGRRFKEEEEEEEEMFTLNCQDRHGVEEIIKNEMPVCNIVTDKPILRSMHERRIRRLTEIECNRLQGFPDGWCQKGINENGEVIDISSTQQYKQMGNAVSVPVVESVGRQILRYEGK